MLSPVVRLSNKICKVLAAERKIWVQVGSSPTAVQVADEWLLVVVLKHGWLKVVVLEAECVFHAIIAKLLPYRVFAF